MKKAYLYIIAIFVISMAFMLYKSLSSCKRLGCVQIKNIEKYEISEIYQESKRAFRASYKSNTNLMKVEVVYNMDEADSEQYIGAGIAKLQGIYTDALVPYPGVASQQTGCDKKLQPTLKKVSTNTEISYFTGYLNSNLTFGTCIESQTTHKGILAFFYCPESKQGFQIQLIAPKKEFDKNPKAYSDMVESINCL
jgi:hypothetical protein